MSEVKILTALKISQCPIWRQKTRYLFQNNHKGGVFAELRKLFVICGKYDILITPGSRTAQLFGLYRTIFKKKKPKHIILELMLDESSDDLVWKIKNLIQRLCFSSVDIIFVSSKKEVVPYAQRLGLSKDRIRFLPFHTNITKPRMVSGSGSYILSAGRTGRDFATLAAAVECLDVQIVLVSDKYHVQGIKFPSNVEIHCDIPYKKYLEFLYDCSMVIVPLKKLIKSTGQVVILESMALGKPVIATNTVGTEDYIEHGVTGILVPPEDVYALRHAIVNFIKDPNFYESMAKRALERIEEKHTFEVYTRTILNTAKEISYLNM